MRNETARSDMRGDSDLAKWWMAIAGIALLGAGLLGFIDNPIVGRSTNALFATDNIHNIVHILTGAIALYIAFGLNGDARANGTIGFGVLYAVVFLALLVSPTLFGLFTVPVNAGDHVLHAALAVVSLAVGYMARDRETGRATA
ncbi:MAG TPA: DUF4383 domain-containing protein [Candidatus Limnocylindrales bacterium]|nr:DUF4383 domain-containing protein [Candidatus Limnocylindrales bacterium]